MAATGSFLGSVLLFSLFLGSTNAQQPCRLGGKPEAGLLQVNQRANVSLECDASCLGPLSRAQLTWTDPRGVAVPAPPGRVFTVNYNQWMTSRLILLDVTTNDSGVYKCQVTHNGLHLQRFTIIRVEETPPATRDPGPRRGDISVVRDPDFPEVRAVRDISSKTDKKFSTNGEGERIKTGIERMNTTTKGESTSDHDQTFVSMDVDNLVDDFNTDGVENNDIQYSEGLTADIALWDETASGRKRMRRSDQKSSATEDGSSEGETSSQLAVTSEALTHTSSVNSQSAAGNFSSATSTTDNDMPSSPSSSTSIDGSTAVTESTSSSDGTTTSVTNSASSTTILNQDKSQPNSDEGSKSSENHNAKTSNPNETGKSEGHAGESSGGCSNDMFGRHGLIAFSVTLAVAVLLLYALLLVILVPRCCGRRKKSVDLATSSPGEENVGLVEKKHKKVEPMTSATGLNGEFITSVDLDAPDQNDEAKKPKDESNEKNEEEAEKTAESFVSTFMLGRLSSSKPEEGADPKVVAGGDDEVFAGPSGKGNDATPTSSAGEKGEPETSTTTPAEEKTEIKFENELSDASKKGDNKDGESQPVQSTDGAQPLQSSDGAQPGQSEVRVEVNDNEKIQDIPLVV